MSFWKAWKKQATADAEVGSVQSDVQVAIKAIEKLMKNPDATVQEILGKQETSSAKTQLTQGVRELGRSLARVLGTKIPR